MFFPHIIYCYCNFYFFPQIVNPFPKLAELVEPVLIYRITQTIRAMFVSNTVFTISRNVKHDMIKNYSVLFKERSETSCCYSLSLSSEDGTVCARQIFVLSLGTDQMSVQMPLALFVKCSL